MNRTRGREDVADGRLPALGPILRQHRDGARLTQEELAEKAGLSTRGLQKLEHGESLPYRATAQRLADALGLQGEARSHFLRAARRPLRVSPTSAPRPTTRTSRPTTPPIVAANTGPARIVERIRELEAATHQAMHEGFLAEALENASRALGLLDRVPATNEQHQHRGALVAALWSLYVQLGRGGEYARLLEAEEVRVRPLGDAGLLGTLATRAACCQLVAGDLVGARATLKTAIELCTIGQNAAEAARAHVLLQWGRLAQGNLSELFLSHEVTVDALSAVPDPAWLAWALAATTSAYAIRGLGRLAATEAEEAYAIAEETQDRAAFVVAEGALALADAASGDHEGAALHARRAGALARSPIEQTWAALCIAFARSRAGFPVESVAALDNVVPSVTSASIVPVQLSVHLGLSLAVWQTGQPEAARHRLATLLPTAEMCGMHYITAVAHRLLGEIAAASTPTDLALAEAHLTNSVTLLGDVQAEYELAQAWNALAQVHTKQGNAEAARAALGTAANLRERLDLSGPPATKNGGTSLRSH